MHILIVGAAGMIGRKLLERLFADGRLGGRELSRATLFDVVPPTTPSNPPFPVESTSGDLATPGQAERLIAKRPDAIFHLAAIVSGAVSYTHLTLPTKRIV